MTRSISLRGIAILLLILIFKDANNQDLQQWRVNIIDSIVAPDGRIAYAIRVPGIPPEQYRAPVAVYDRASKTIPLVPAFTWSFGCSATSAAMIAGHYDNVGYPNMYVGSTNNGVMPMDNTAWPDVIINGETRHNCPLSATANGLDGRTSDGHVDDYWISYGSPGPDPWTVAGGGTGVQHTYGYCTGDYMKTNQWINSGEGYNTDGSTTFWSWNNGAQMTASDLEGLGVQNDDGMYGLKLFYQSRGYSISECFTQPIVEEGLTYGFTYAQFKAQIDAGHPVLIHVTNHTMVGYGYNDGGGTNLVYIHDTWDHNDHSMVWGGSYGGLDHYGVSVVNLNASTINVWNGSLSNLYGTSLNWSLGHVPDATEIVVIPNLNTPVIIDYSDKVAGYLYLYPGASLRIMDNRLSVTNDFYVGGTIEFNDDDAVLHIGDDIFWQDGSSVVVNSLGTSSPLIYVYGDWDFREGANVQFPRGMVDFRGTSTSWIRAYSAGSYFRNIKNNKTGGAYIALSGSSTTDMTVGGNIYMYSGSKLIGYSDYKLVVNGFLNNMDGNITMESGTLAFNGNPGSTGLKMNTGDYVNNLEINTGMASLQLDDTYSNTLWVKGNMNIQSGYLYAYAMNIRVDGNWTNAAGTSAFVQGTSTVTFHGTGNQYIYGSEIFYNLEANTGGMIRIINSAYNVSCTSYDWTAGGIYVSSGSFTADDLADNGIFGSYTLYSPGTINLYQDAGQYIDLNATLHLYSGHMNVYGGSGTSFWAYANDITVDINVGTLDFKDNGIYLYPSHNLFEDISGGRVRTSGSFTGTARNDFTPSGGVFEFYGTSDRTINIGDNRLFSVEVNKGASTDNEGSLTRQIKPPQGGTARKEIVEPVGRSNTLTLADSLELLGDLVINSGVLDVSATNYPIYLAGNWTNNVGPAGFNERYGRVVFDGTGPSDILSDETFFDLVEDKTYASFDGVENGSGDNAGTSITILGDLYVQDGTFELNSPSNLEIAGDMIISSGAVVNANDANAPMNISVGSIWMDYNSSGGFLCGNSSQVTFNSVSPGSVQSVRETSYFNDIVINSLGAYIRPNSISYPIKCSDLKIVDGILYVAGYKVIVSDTLYNGDYIRMNSSLDTLEAAYLDWQPGSYDNITAGKIFVSGDWIYEDGTNATITSGNTVYFTGTSTGFIKSYDPDARFYNVVIDKPGSSVWIHTSTTQPVHINSNLNVMANSLFHVQYGDLLVDGIADIANTGSMYEYSGGSITLASDFTLNGFVKLSGGGDFLGHGTFSQASTGRIDMSGGTFILDKAYYSPRGFFALAGTLNMSGGTMEFTNNHLNLQSTFVENITGGTIRVGGTMLAFDGVFTPEGGTVELISSGIGGPYFDLHTGNWFNNLTINGSDTYLVYDSQNLYIKGNLLISQGGMNASNDIIYLAGDWTNNVGPTAFSEGTGTVYLNGTSGIDTQVINGETFYNLVNLNTARAVEIAGNTIVQNILEVGGGGSACSIFVTCNTLDIQNSLNLQNGTLALSSSAPLVTAANFTQGGTLQLTNGTFIADDLASSGLRGTYILYNGQIDLHQDVIQNINLDADITISNGVFNIYGGFNYSIWPYPGTIHSLTMSDGLLDFKDNGIFVNNSNFTENISGGRICTSRYFQCNTTNFTPAGGTIEMCGASSVFTQMGSGSYFNNLLINKEPGYTVSAYTDMDIHGELRVSGGNFNTNNHIINVGAGSDKESVR